MTQACFPITKSDKIVLFHNIISASCPAEYLHKNSSTCIIMCFYRHIPGDLCEARLSKKS
nr:hypothetical protein [unidentified bacterial endosymbiont]